MLAADKIIQHTAAHRTRPVQGVQGGDIFDRGRLQLAHQVAHAGGIQLENTQGLAAAEQFVSLFII